MVRKQSSAALACGPISTPDPLTCGTIAVARWVATCEPQHHGESIAWTSQSEGIDDGVADWAGGAEITISQPGEYVINVTVPVASDCGLYNWSTLKINGTAVHSAKSLGGLRTLRNLYTLTKVGTSADVVTVGFTTDGDGGGYTKGAVITIEKVS
jgi:hypothetical protein